MKNKKSARRTVQSSLVYRCLHDRCNLFYGSILGLKRHIACYDHALYGMSERVAKCPIKGCDMVVPDLSATEQIHGHFKEKHTHRRAAQLKNALLQIVRAYDSTKRDSIEQEAGAGCINYAMVMQNGDALVRDMLCYLYPNGVIRINDVDKPGVIFCGVHGCGKHFKSIMAYRYHCQTFTHSFAPSIDAYCRHKEMCAEYDRVLEQLKTELDTCDKFCLWGITHHSFFSPDQFFSITFSVAMDREPPVSKKKVAKKSEDTFVCKHLLADDASAADGSDGAGTVLSRIYYRGIKHEISEKIDASDFRCFNLRNEITAAHSLGQYFCVAYRNFGGNEAKMFEFFKEECKIDVFYQRERVRQFVFSHGFARRIRLVQATPDSCRYFVLFNDGFVRYFENDRPLHVYRQPKITDFVLFDGHRGSMLVATDGFILYKFKDNRMITTSTRSEFPIIALEPRNTENEELFLLNANGRITCCDRHFRNEQEILTHAGVTNIIFLRSLNGLVLCDTFAGATKLFFLDCQQKTYALSNDFVCCATNIDKTLVSGTYGGTVKASFTARKKKMYTEKIFEIVRRKDCYIVCSDERELSVLKNRGADDFSTAVRVVDVFFVDDFLVVVVMGGLVVFLRTEKTKHIQRTR